MLNNQEHLFASDHLVAWAVYGAAAAVLLIILWRFTRRWPWDARWLLLALAAVLLLTPSPVPGHELMAPAMIFLALGGITGGAEVIAPALVRLSLAGIVAIVLVVIAGFWHRRLQQRARQRAETESRRRRYYS